MLPLPVLPWLHQKSSLAPALSCCYPYLSQARGWTVFSASLQVEELSLQVRTDCLPAGEEDKSHLYLGLQDQAVTRLSLWRREAEVWGEVDGRRFRPIALPDSSSPVNIPVKPEPPVTISSLGVAPEFAWDLMGQYEFRGILNSANFYVQSCTVKRFRVNYLYFTGARWVVGPWAVDEGGNMAAEKFSGLRNVTEDPAVPLTGWECYNDRTHVWMSDSACTARTGPHQDCGEVTVSSSGAAGRKYPDHFGVFRPTDMWSSGRRVYKLVTGEKFLCVPVSANNNHHWVITTSPGLSTAKVSSSCVSNCPASSRARHYDNFHQRAWHSRHGLGFWREDSSITVSCNRLTRDCH